MRVLHLLPSLQPAGAERVATDILCHLDPAAFEPHLTAFYAHPESALETALGAAGVPVTVLGKRPGFDPQTFARLRRVLRRVRPDLVHTHGYPLFYALPALLALDIPGVHTVHTLAEEEVGRVGRLANRAAFATRVSPVCVSRQSAESFAALYGTAPPPVVPNGIDLEGFARPAVARAAWRAAHGLAETDRVVLVLARFRPVKNHGAIVSAFAQVARDLPHARLLLVGDGPLQGDVEAQVRRRGLADRVRFLGLRSDIVDILHASDLFVLFSEFEGQPISLLEAMAAGCPAVLGAVGGIPETVEGGREAVLVPKGDVGALAREIRALLEDHDRRRALSRAARARVRRDYSLAAMTRTYEALYRRAVEGDGGRIAAFGA